MNAEKEQRLKEACALLLLKKEIYLKIRGDPDTTKMMIDSLKKEADYYETCEIYNKNGTVNGELTLEFFRVSFLLSVIENSKGKESNSSYMHLQKGIYNFLFTEVSEESCERKREWVRLFGLFRNACLLCTIKGKQYEKMAHDPKIVKLVAGIFEKAAKKNGISIDSQEGLNSLPFNNKFLMDFHCDMVSAMQIKGRIGKEITKGMLQGAQESFKHHENVLGREKVGELEKEAESLIKKFNEIDIKKETVSLEEQSGDGPVGDSTEKDVENFRGMCNIM